MLALEEKVRTVVLLKSDLTDAEVGEQVFSKFQAAYLDVKAHKPIFMTNVDSDSFFHYLPKEQRMMGLMQVIVLENLDSNVVEETMKLIEVLQTDLEATTQVYCSQGAWEASRDLEYFFPHLTDLPLERTLALIKPDGIARGRMEGLTLEEMVEAKVAEAGLLVAGRRQVTLKEAEAKELCKALEGTPDFQGAVGVILADPGCIAMCLEGPGAIGKWNLLCGPSNCGIARERAPTTLRAMWGTDGTSNALHASASMEASEAELTMMFPEGMLSLQRTLCIVKPDAMPVLLQVRQSIEEKGFTVLAEKQTTLTEDRARDFYRDFKEKPFFNALVKHACSGPCCILVLCRLNAVAVWQQVMGPDVVRDARRTRPGSLRALYGRDGQRNAVHGSESVKTAGREVQFFFPELGADPMPDDEAVRDYLFRKAARASMDLKTLDDADTFGAGGPDTTVQELLSKGLMQLCKVQPKGLGAVRWLSRWLMENNPNQTAADAAYDFAPQARTTQVIENGINQDGLAFVVEAPPGATRKQVVDVDVSQEAGEQRTSDLSTPPFVVFLCGGPGVGKNSQCAKLRDDFNLVHLSVQDLMRQEVAAKTYLGTEIYKSMQQGTVVPDSIILKLLKKAMVKMQDTNRFLLEGFPKSLEQAKRFEQEVAEFAFGLYFEGSSDLMRKRVAERAAKTPGRVDDNPETVEKLIKIFEEQTVPVIDYYTPIGKIRSVQCEKDGEEEGAKVEKDVETVYTEAKRFFSARILYMVGPPGAPITAVGDRLEAKYGYSSIDFNALLKTLVDAGGKDAVAVAAAIKKGKPVDASIACPLVLSEIYRDMALGVQNFVICDFPQSTQQSDFLEFRIPSNTKTLLLDFERADAEDLQTFASGMDAVEVDVKLNALFGAEAKKMFKDLGSALVRVPCSLAGLEKQDQLVDSVWTGVRDKVMPGVTIVLGLPGSGTEQLANQLAITTPNTYVVDCDQLLDKELERRTELGLTMHNMLARGQVVPLSMTMELLKNVFNLTSSDNMVILNCPMYVDQIEYITKEFRIDRVFYISGSEKAVGAWKDSFCTAGGEERIFSEHIDRLVPIVTHFSRLGKLEQFDVIDTPKPKVLSSMIEQATMPQFAIMNGVSAKTTGTQADMLASVYGVGPALTTAFVEKWSKEVLKRTVDPANPSQMFSALQQYADSNGFPLLVLNRYPNNDKDTAAFVKYFGDPKVAAFFNVDEEAHMEGFKEENPDDETEAEELASRLEADRKQHDKNLEEFKAKCAPSVMSVSMADVAATNTTADALSLQIRNRLLPKVYVLMAPSGKADFSGLIANTICTSRREGKRPVKFTIIDSDRLFQPGGHSTAIEDRLRKASFTADAPDTVPAPLWKELFTEALQASANPMGTFIITNFPTPCCMTATPTIRDQFSMLESISTFMGIVHVKVTENAYPQVVAGVDYATYDSFESQVKNATLVQFGADKIKEVIVDQVNSPEDAAAAVAADFLTFQEKAEQARR